MSYTTSSYTALLSGVLLVGFATGLDVNWVLAAEPASDLALNDDTGSLVMAIVKVFSALAVVVGLMLVLLNWVRKLGLGKVSGKPGSMIRVLDTKMIAPKKYVAVLQVPGERIVVGVTDQQINLLTTLGESGDVDEESAPQQSTGPATFSNMLRSAESLLSNKKKSEQGENS